MARKIILYDLENGILSLEENETSAAMAWKFYSQLKEFQEVPESQFRERLKDHRKQIEKLQDRATEEEALFVRDRELHPRSTRNNRGELVFDLSEAKELLREDVSKKIHKKMTPSQLRASRDKYKSFSNSVFKQRIYQEVRYQKYLNYLNQKREKAIRQRNLCFQEPPMSEDNEQDEFSSY